LIGVGIIATLAIAAKVILGNGNTEDENCEEVEIAEVTSSENQI
jgi:hypothetical protein